MLEEPLLHCATTCMQAQGVALSHDEVTHNKGFILVLVVLLISSLHDGGGQQ